MMMGPAPMMRTVWISVLFGMAYGGLASGAGLAQLFQSGQQRLDALGWHVLLHQLQQSVAFDDGPQHFGFGRVERRVPLLEFGREGVVVPGFALGQQRDQRHGLVLDKGLAVGF